MFGFGPPKPFQRGMNPNTPFMDSYSAYSAAILGKFELNKGNKIVLPPSALNTLARLKVSYPMVFMISNPKLSMKTYCGVLEFIAEEGNCYLPFWMMNNLLLEEGGNVMVQNKTLKKGSFVSLRPHETAFIEFSNPKAILEQELTHYSCLCKNDTINIQYADRNFLIDVLDCKPDDAICVVEADIKVDFQPPLDYKPPVPKTLPPPETPMEEVKEGKEQEPPKVQKGKPFTGKAIRLDGGKLTNKQMQILKKGEEDELPFDPRAHRLPNGIVFNPKAVELLAGKTVFAFKGKAHKIL